MRAIDVVTFGETMVQLNAKNIGQLRDVREWEQHAAGAESNFAIGIVKMGLSAGWISRLGKDGFGEYILRVIKGYGVDVSQVKFDASAPTGVYFIWHPKEGESKVMYYRKGSAASRLSPGDIKEEYIKKARWLHLTGITPALSNSCKDACFKAIEYAKRFGIKVSFDVNLRKVLWRDLTKARKIFEKIAAESDVVKVGLDEFRVVWNKDLSIREACEFIARKFDCEALVTMGRYACVSNRKETVCEKAMKVKVVDPIGAGDAFMATYVASKIKGCSLQESLRRAHVAGALTCTKRGDVEAIPTWNEIENYL